MKNYTEMYLDYVNNFLTVQAFADHYDIHIDMAKHIIELGKQANDGDFDSNELYWTVNNSMEINKNFGSEVLKKWKDWKYGPIKYV